MNELLEKYKHITHQATILAEVCEHSCIARGSTIQEALNRIKTITDNLAHEIVIALQQQIDADAEQAVKGPEPINNVLHKPLWAVVPKDEPDDIWRTVDKHYGGLRYRVYLSKEKAEQMQGNFGKVVPVWGE